jgi:hypothetical protein
LKKGDPIILSFVLRAFLVSVFHVPSGGTMNTSQAQAPSPGVALPPQSGLCTAANATLCQMNFPAIPGSFVVAGKCLIGQSFKALSFVGVSKHGNIVSLNTF